jgi:sulfur carrier protein
MSDGLTVQINGKERSFAELRAGVPLAGLVEALGLKADRIAVELNGTIAPRTEWAERVVKDGDRVEIVHFVGGGAGGMVGWSCCKEQQQEQQI